MNTKKTLTIFTPAYNRAHTIGRTYESLLMQGNKDFIWLIVDDGSTDNTKELIKKWQSKNNGFDIIYIYKENGGMHTAHNTAYENITTELNVCIDSDDKLAPNAVEKILKLWDNVDKKKYAGIIGLDADFSGKIIGNGFPKNLKSTTLSGYYKNGGCGDKKLVYRTDIMKKYPPYPVFDGEKYVSLGYKYQLCDQDYELIVLNDILCEVEYQENGSSMNMYNQYINNPKGFAFIRKQDMKYKNSKMEKFKACIHYVSSSIISHNNKFIHESPLKLLTIIAIPLGLLLTIYIKYKSRGLMKVIR